jgi:RNA polymerase sigma-70 factor (ECF subfamily)
MDRKEPAFMDREAAAREFERHRPRLLGIAYRLLGSVWDAEDVVEEAALRWLSADGDDVREPVAFLTTIVSRLALDHLRSARVRREEYYGPWLPEPALTSGGPFGPLDTVERRESVSMATLLLLERLTPPERAVFVLRAAFDLPYDEIARILEVTEAHARQLFHRAQAHVGGEQGRFEADPAQHAELFERFLAAAAEGNLADLEKLLAQDVVAYNDGGGKVRAAPHPVAGLSKVLRFVAGLLDRFPLGELRLVEANGHPAALLSMGGQRQLVAIGVRDGRIHEIYAVLNPDKLGYAERQLAAAG